ncbi:hypothetical protein OG883_22680 [Streptomyces sp. NBC_01142]|uniref:hypothetical protein n=1 Tax=Streptomyces sp. NBC_01142 TaxID=2975865 RepID=UPI002254A99F|nr:hypothetical protein [Streptomyces sp. NBC_01142]MCX4822652.1 hypothetical protein [Streptomyces sp. NBC_01142]
MGGSRFNRLARTARPMALVSAMATLLGALFLCLSPTGPHHTPHTDLTGTDVTTAYSCPYDRGDCGLLPALTPAVLTAPPVDAPPLAGVQPPHFAPPPATGRLHRSGALPRAPDLHVLQVLRT